MKLLVGLGNPGNKYKGNRHNTGFMVLDAYIAHVGLVWKFSQDFMCYFVKDGDVVFMKPDTFMNDSGSAVANVAKFFKIKREDVLVIYDDLDLPFGKIRLSFDGLSAGHKGIDSIMQGLSGVDFGRLRIGIGRPTHADVDRNPSAHTLDAAEYVLEDFSEADQKQLPTMIKLSHEAIVSYLADGIEATMNKFN